MSRGTRGSDVPSVWTNLDGRLKSLLLDALEGNGKSDQAGIQRVAGRLRQRGRPRVGARFVPCTPGSQMSGVLFRSELTANGLQVAVQELGRYNLLLQVITHTLLLWILVRF